MVTKSQFFLIRVLEPDGLLIIYGKMYFSKFSSRHVYFL
nr:MAG TPA: Protein DRE2 [Caudoviricetes sp.]